MGLRHGLREESEVMAWRRRERYDTVIKEARSSSPRISAMSSTGSASNCMIMESMKKGGPAGQKSPGWYIADERELYYRLVMAEPLSDSSQALARVAAHG